MINGIFDKKIEEKKSGELKKGSETVGLSIYFLYNITVFENIQHNIILQQLYNGIQEKVI